jgi:hypothetical protein
MAAVVVSAITAVAHIVALVTCTVMQALDPCRRFGG